MKTNPYIYAKQDGKTIKGWMCDRDVPPCLAFYPKDGSEVLIPLSQILKSLKANKVI